MISFVILQFNPCSRLFNFHISMFYGADTYDTKHLLERTTGEYN